MRKILLTRNKYASVDDEYYELLNKYKWHCTKAGYAVRRLGKNGKFIYMHRFISDASGNEIVDHINGDRLNNKKCNLRICTQSINTFNQRVRKDNTTGIRGVYWDKKREKWYSCIQKGSKRFFLGRFDSKERCKKEYIKKAKLLYGFLPYAKTTI